MEPSGIRSKDDQIRIIVLYMDFLSEHPKRPNLTNCMAALGDHLRINMADESIIHNWIIRGAKKSLTRQNGRELSLLKDKRIRLPTPFTFMKYILETYMSQPPCWDTCDNYMTGLANMLAYEFGLRVSEYCYNKDAEDNHAIMGGDVFFDAYLSNGVTVRLTSWQLNSDPAGSKKNIQAKNYPNSNCSPSIGIHPSSVNQIHLLLRSQKNHQDGNTRRLVLQRNHKQLSSPLNTLIDCVVTFAKFSNIGPEDPFFSRWKVTRKILHRKMVSKMLKDTAKALGYLEENFSSHCNRIGCASDLYQAGYTPEDISMFIGWTSNAVFGYLQAEPPSLFSLAGQEAERIIKNKLPKSRK
jgi:hypothetical protein